MEKIIKREKCEPLKALKNEHMVRFWSGRRPIDLFVFLTNFVYEEGETWFLLPVHFKYILNDVLTDDSLDIVSK